jgi:hypothetical protein
MFRIRVVRSVALVGGLVAALVWLASVPGPASAATKSSALVLHLKWRRVTSELSKVATSDRYLALLTYPDPQTPYDSGSIVLRDEKTNTQKLVVLPDACEPNRAPVGFGGPWLVVGCSGAAHWLYNLNSQQWLPVSAKCPADCSFVGVGSYWLKFASTEHSGCSEHCGDFYFLQNLQTGQVEPDPAKPGGRTLDDLNARSGRAPLCAPLHYPTFQNTDLGTRELGSFQFSGPFALASGDPYDAIGAVYHLERCRSLRVLALKDASTNYPPFISSRAVVFSGLRQVDCKHRPYGLACSNRISVSGLYLHGLRQFTAAFPTTTVPPYSSPGEVVGLTRRTIYVDAPAPNGALWAATLPQPPAPRHH